MVKMDPHEILLYPYVTEKSLNLMAGTAPQGFKDGNKLEFIVASGATKRQIAEAFEKLFEAKVEKVNVLRLKDGKHAIIKLKQGYSAEDIGMRIGVF
jgi:large subunit ribosomal protein L23